MKTTLILLIAVVIGYGQTGVNSYGTITTADTTKYYVDTTYRSWGKIFVDTVGYVIENRIDTATVTAVYDSLGYVKMARVFRLGFWKKRVGHWWTTQYHYHGYVVTNYDSTLYIKDGMPFKYKVLMEFNMGGGK